MSRDVGSITVTFPFSFTFKDWVSLIDYFEKIDYRLQNGIQENIQYLPLGGEFGDFDWQFERIDKEKLLSIFEQKIRKGEQVGFCLSPLENPVDDIVIVSNQSDARRSSIEFQLSSSSRVIGRSSVTDFSAYLKFITPICYAISKEFNLECCQYIDRM